MVLVFYPILTIQHPLLTRTDHGAREMKLTIFAATGGIGRHVLEQAGAPGDQGTAVLRNPKKPSGQGRPNVSIVDAHPGGAGPAKPKSPRPKARPGASG